MRAETTAQVKYYMAQELNGAWTLMEEGIDYTLTVTSESGYDDIELEVIGDAANHPSAFYRLKLNNAGCEQVGFC